MTSKFSKDANPQDVGKVGNRNLFIFIISNNKNRGVPIIPTNFIFSISFRREMDSYRESRKKNLPFEKKEVRITNWGAKKKIYKVSLSKFHNLNKNIC